MMIAKKVPTKVLFDRQFLWNSFEALQEISNNQESSFDRLLEDSQNGLFEFYLFESDLQSLCHSYPDLQIQWMIENSWIKVIPKNSVVHSNLSPSIFEDDYVAGDVAAAMVAEIDVIIALHPDSYFINSQENYGNDLSFLLGWSRRLWIWSYPGFLLRNSLTKNSRNYLEQSLDICWAKTPRTFSECVHQIFTWVESDASRVICSGNVASLCSLTRKLEYYDLLHQMDLITAAGQPIVYGIHRYGIQNQQRVSDVELLNALCQGGDARKMKFYFLIGHWCQRPERLRKFLSEKLSDYPDLEYEIEFCSKDRDQHIIDAINGTNTRKSDLVIVARKTPRQEEWMCEHRNLVKAPMLGIGESIEFFAGLYQESPDVVQYLGFDWFMRSCQKPRLGMSYLRSMKIAIPCAVELAFNSSKTELDAESSVCSLIQAIGASRFWPVGENTKNQRIGS